MMLMVPIMVNPSHQTSLTQRTSCKSSKRVMHCTHVALRRMKTRRLMVVICNLPRCGLKQPATESQELA
jgi:hypothetical protein